MNAISFFLIFAFFITISESFFFPPAAPAAPKVDPCCCAPPPPPPCGGGCGCGGKRKKREVTSALRCNSQDIEEVIDDSLTDDITETMAVLKSKLLGAKNGKYTVICTPNSQTFDFSTQEDGQFCSRGNDDVTCHVFKDDAHPTGVIFK